MADLITAAEWLDIGGYPFATPAARITDLTPLFSAPALRGTDVIMPGANGARPYPRLRGVTKITLPGVVFGDADREGTAHTDARAGLFLNLDAIHAEVTALAAGDGTRVATWTRGDGTVWKTGLHVEGFECAALSPTTVRFRLSLSLPSWWVEVTP